MADIKLKDLETGSASLVHRALHLTQLLIWDLFNHQTDKWLNVLDEQFVLVTPHAVVYRTDAARFNAARASIVELLSKSRNLDSLQYHIHVIGRDTCGITVSTTPAGRQPDANSLSPDLSLYCTLIWTQRDQKVLLSHCHVHAENVPPAALRATSKPQALAAASVRQAAANRHAMRLQMRTADGQTHWIDRNDIVYVKACRQYTELHCTSRTLRLHALFKDVLAQLGTTVVRVHRSYAVSPRFVDSLRGEMLHLTTGEKVPIPSRKIKEIRDLLGQEV